MSFQPWGHDPVRGPLELNGGRLKCLAIDKKYLLKIILLKIIIKIPHMSRVLGCQNTDCLW